MKKDEYLGGQERDHESDDVEILEVVGVDDGASGWPEDDRSAESDDGEDEDIVLSLDGDEDEAEGDLPLDDAVSVSSGPAVAAGAEVEQMLRLQADYDNLRKRVKRERVEFEAYATSSLVGRLLPVLDNFERALAVESEDAQGPFREGLLMIYKQLSGELRREGLQAIEAVGCEFDPNVHDAVATDDRSEYPANTVIEEMQRGYKFGDRLLRPAMVRVSTNGGKPDGETP